jgi:hypothetical protein
VIIEGPDTFTVVIDNLYPITVPGGQTGVLYVPALKNTPGHPNGGIGVSSTAGCGTGDPIDVQATDTYTVRVMPCRAGQKYSSLYPYPFTVTDDRTGVVVNG